jgi:hypothetical protein
MNYVLSVQGLRGHGSKPFHEPSTALVHNILALPSQSGVPSVSHTTRTLCFYQSDDPNPSEKLDQSSLDELDQSSLKELDQSSEMLFQSESPESVQLS